jgi:hypothetical protein
VTIGPHRSACGLLALLARPALAQTSSLSADSIVSVARRDIGKIDREVRTEFRQPPLSASVDAAMGLARYRDKNRAGFNYGQANLSEPLVGVCPRMI